MEIDEPESDVPFCRLADQIDSDKISVSIKTTLAAHVKSVQLLVYDTGTDVPVYVEKMV